MPICEPFWRLLDIQHVWIMSVAGMKCKLIMFVIILFVERSLAHVRFLRKNK